MKINISHSFSIPKQIITRNFSETKSEDYENKNTALIFIIPQSFIQYKD